jgi:hypothetical protein
MYHVLQCSLFPVFRTSKIAAFVEKPTRKAFRELVTDEVTKHAQFFPLRRIG